TLLDEGVGLPLPRRIQRVRLSGELPKEGIARASRNGHGADFVLADADGRTRLVIEGLETTGEPTVRAAEVAFIEEAEPAPSGPPEALLVGGQGPLLAALAAAGEPGVRALSFAEAERTDGGAGVSDVMVALDACEAGDAEASLAATVGALEGLVTLARARA